MLSCVHILIFIEKINLKGEEIPPALRKRSPGHLWGLQRKAGSQEVLCREPPAPCPVGASDDTSLGQGWDRQCSVCLEDCWLVYSLMAQLRPLSRSEVGGQNPQPLPPTGRICKLQDLSK